jgi:phosphatidylglycerophosphate synthase
VTSRSIVNAISLSRVGLAFLFVLTFQRNATLFAVSVAVCLIALATDVLDGYVARKWRVASIHGRLWDSLGDKTFYIATIVAFNAQGFLGPIVSWALVVREVALYITRILYIDKLPKIEQVRPLTNWHGYFMCLAIFLGLGQMYVEMNGLMVDLHLYVQISAYIALVFGIASIGHFLRLT